MPQRPLAQQAGILCNDPRFCRLVAKRLNAPCGAVTPSAAAEYLRQHCRITSRRALDSDSAAAARFAVLCTEFDAWTGKISRPR
mgnify:CR=1 FL=1